MAKNARAESVIEEVGSIEDGDSVLLAAGIVVVFREKLEVVNPVCDVSRLDVVLFPALLLDVEGALGTIEE